MLQTTRALHREGHSTASIRARVQKNTLESVRRGVYAAPADLTLSQEHERLVLATMPLLKDGSVVSHGSAALLHGLPVWNDQLRWVDVVREGDFGSWRSRHLFVRGAPLPEEDVVTIRGVRVTSLARTLVDLGRSVAYEQAVAALDAGLARGVERDDLEARIADLGSVRGIATLRGALGFADARSGSTGESFSRVVLDRLGIPRPDLQRRILCSRTGRFLACTDFAWDDLKVVGEFDGRVKYDGTLQDPATAIMAEKDRELGLRADGWAVLRWTWADLLAPERIRRLWDAEVDRRH